jgi:hypothetical protein
VWIIGLAVWSVDIMFVKAKCLKDFIVFPGFLSMVGIIIAVADPVLNACLGSVLAADSEQPFYYYLQDRQHKEVVIFIRTTVSIIWTAFCILYTKGSLCGEDALPSYVPGKSCCCGSCCSFITPNFLLSVFSSFAFVSVNNI